MSHEGSFIRWQSIGIAQLGYAIGLILSSATASLAFTLVLIKDQSYIPGCWGKAVMLTSMLSLIASIALGLWCVVNRLRDFRITESTARDREDLDERQASKEEKEKLLASRRTETDRLGKRTWHLFWWQIGTFALGISALTIAFGIIYHSKIF